MLTVSLSLCVCVYRGSRETRVVVLESGWWSSESYPTICVTWAAASLGVHSSALMAMPGTLFRLFSDSCQTAWLSVCVQLRVYVCVSPLCRLCFTSTSIITVFNCCFYYRISFTFSLVRSLRLGKLVGFSFPSPFPCPFGFLVCSPSLFLLYFFAFVFMILRWQALHAAYLPLLYSLRTFSVHFLHDFPHEQQQQPGMCVCVCVCLFYRVLNNCASYKLIMQQLHFVMLLSRCYCCRFH